jgi:sugar O-acyltransferase (sialic acid O-acetyltransferase NeuD family)
MVKQLIIAGMGGFGAEVAWVAEEMNRACQEQPVWKILGYVDDNPQKINPELYGYRVLGRPEEVASQFSDQEIWYCCAIGDNSSREKMAHRLDQSNWRPATLIHPSVVSAKNVSLGHGAYVGALSVIAPNCRIGNHVIINLHVSIGHDARIEDFANICPGAQINGFCVVGHGALVGSNASLVQGREVGENARVCSNSLVVQSVAANKSVIGVPARELPSFGK